MAKGKKGAEPKGRKVTLKMAKAAVRVTVDGKRRLDLSNMDIASFPKCILQLSDVEELDLSRNLLRKLPDSIDRFTNLRWLDLHSNQLESVPRSVGRLQSLVSLNLSNNRLAPAGLPPEMGLLTALRSLNLGLNRLDVAPGFLSALRELRELGLFGNQLTSEPDALLRGLAKLQRVNMADNPLTPSSSPPPQDAVRSADHLYLVRQAHLCHECHLRCQLQRQRLESRASGHTPDHKGALFTGLITPNSVAQQEQEVWR
ncbi:leucine-rich repeat-containing protein 18 [Alosa sapidissima]|uniref:leucine-rich repeat-containing protein 18 n=1 Tax=Alosa sapidissima TaxID=34773 RepID=UPI001C08BAA3|nr:leucine-rich repeat-containing protein 18 [Alosa sapidissima]XP_041942221.1 leucine-rich repeat-containing protein 18 [Alosa sapidissima]XP_041942222.1 leucine-rich repeat-containing protein 18 [Alosa sapidissima]